MQRTWKPFNPILGETYEMTNHGGITFIAEQVIFYRMTFNGYYLVRILIYLFKWTMAREERNAHLSLLLTILFPFGSIYLSKFFTLNYNIFTTKGYDEESNQPLYFHIYHLFLPKTMKGAGCFSWW